MSCPHNNSVLLGERSVFGIIKIEHAIPHCGPEVVRLQSKQKLKDSCMEVSVETWTSGASSWVKLVHPICQRRLFVVKENSTVFYAGRTRNCNFGKCKNGWFRFEGNIGPPPPRTNTNLLRNVIDTKNRSSSITSGNNQSLSNTLDRVIY